MRILATLLCVLAFGFAAPSALAEDKPADSDKPSAVEKLKAEELAALKKRLPKPWESYTAEQQERLARGILRLRNLTPEQRRKLEWRLQQAMQAKKAGVDINKRLDGMRANRHHYDASFKIGKGMGRLIREALSPETRRKLAQLPVRGRHLDMALSRLFLENAITATEKNVMELDASVLPERLQKHFVAKREKASKVTGDKAARYRRHLAHIYITGQALKLIEGVERPPRKSREEMQALTKEQRQERGKAYEAYFNAIGLKAKAAWPTAFDDAVAKITELADNPERIGQLIVKHARSGRDGRGSRGRMNDSPVMQLLMFERHLKGLPNEAELRGNLDQLLRGILVGKYKLDPAKVEQILAKPNARERVKLLMRFMAEAGIKPGQGGMRRPGRRGARGGMRGPGQGGNRDGGKDKKGG